MARRSRSPGLKNVHYAIPKGGEFYVLGMFNPLATEPCPSVAKAIGLPVGHRIPRDGGESLKSMNLNKPKQALSVKEAVLPFARFPA